MPVVIWPEVKFEDLYSDPSRNGLTRPRSVRGSGEKMVNMKEIFAYDRIKGQEMELVPLAEKEAEKFLLEAGDLLFARQSLVLEGAGKCSIVLETPEPTTFESHLIRVRLKKDLVNPEYFYYYFSSPQGKGKVRSLVNQVAAAGIRGSELALLKIPLPEKQYQNQVAGILANYDNLIENNNRRIAILEDMAQSLYREWFVKFRFPGHENCQFKDSALGRIPEGWGVEKLKDITSKIGSGATPRGGKGAYKSEGTPLIRSMNIYDSQFISKNLAFIDDAQAEKLKNVVVEPGDVLLNITGASVARCAIVPTAFTPARVNQHVSIIRINGSCICSNYVLYTLISHTGKTRLLNIAQGGATREAITKVHIESFEILIPPEEISESFSDLASPVTREKELLFLKNENMKQQRDMLLPKLINGKITI
jgi:type I restriction enzyme S subunit